MEGLALKCSQDSAAVGGKGAKGEVGVWNRRRRGPCEGFIPSGWER